MAPTIYYTTHDAAIWITRIISTDQRCDIDSKLLTKGKQQAPPASKISAINKLFSCAVHFYVVLFLLFNREHPIRWRQQTINYTCINNCSVMAYGTPRRVSTDTENSMIFTISMSLSGWNCHYSTIERALETNQWWQGPQRVNWIIFLMLIDGNCY